MWKEWEVRGHLPEVTPTSLPEVTSGRPHIVAPLAHLLGLLILPDILLYSLQPISREINVLLLRFLRSLLESMENENGFIVLGDVHNPILIGILPPDSYLIYAAAD